MGMSEADIAYFNSPQFEADIQQHGPFIPEPAPPPPPPPPSSNPRYDQLTAPGGPSLFGNRMDKPEGRAREAEMRAAEAALIVAQSQASQGNIREAQAAYDESQRRAKLAAAGKPATGFTQGFNAALQQTFPEGRPKEIVTTVQEPEKPKPEPPKPTPIQPSTARPAPTFRTPDPPKPKVVKNPNRDVVNFSREEFSQSSIARLLFEQVGSIELVNIARRETIEGQNPYYTLISNLSSIAKNFDPTSLISRQKSNRNIEDNYSIDLNNKIPDDEYLDRNNLTDFYYIDDNGDLVIELDNLASDEIIDIEIATSGTINLVDEA